MLPRDPQNFAQYLLILESITKSFGNRHVLNDISFRFGHGAFAIGGPNGCGKTTLLSVIAGIVTPDRGQILVNGVDMGKNPTSAKALIGYLPDEPCIYPFLKGVEFLNLVGAIRNVKDMSSCREILDVFRLHPYLDASFSSMSLGTQRKFMLTSVFMQPLPLLLLDEPSNALDTGSRDHLVRMIQAHGAASCTIMADHDQLLLQEIAAKNLRLEAGRLLS